MINLLINFIIFVLNLVNSVSFGIIDNQAVVYGILIAAVVFLLIVVEKHTSAINVISQRGTTGDKFLFLIGLVLNAMSSWVAWLIGITILAYTFWKLDIFNPKGRRGIVARIKGWLKEMLADDDETQQPTSQPTATKPWNNPRP